MFQYMITDENGRDISLTVVIAAQFSATNYLGYGCKACLIKPYTKSIWLSSSNSTNTSTRHNEGKQCLW